MYNTQSSILRPLLFNVHINDLPLLPGNCLGMLYPDDTIINHSCANVNELQDVLSCDLQNVLKWVQMNGLKLNVQRTQLLLLGHKGMSREVDQVRVCM